MSVDNLFNEQEITQLKEGGVVSKSYKDTGSSVVEEPSTYRTPGSDVDDGVDSTGVPDIKKPKQVVTRPRIEGSGSYVTRPQIDAYNKADAAFKLQQIEAREAAQAELDARSPDKLHSSIAYLERTVKKLQKEINTLKRENK